MERKKWIRLGIVALVVAALCAVLFFGNYRIVDGRIFPKDAAVLDLTEHSLSAEKYDAICQRYPDAQVLWTVPFQGERYPMDTESITVASLSETDMIALSYLEQLTYVDAAQCTDYEMLSRLQTERPELQVVYRIIVSDTVCSSTAQELTVADADADQLEAALSVLPKLTSVTLEGQLPDASALAKLQTDFPDVSFHFTVEIGGTSVSSDAESLDLSGCQISFEELTQAISALVRVKEVILTGTNLTSDECKELMLQFPDIFFLCQLDFAGKLISTDTTFVDISKTTVTIEEVEAMIPFFPRAEKLDMSFCGFDDESMDALNQRYPDIAILWTMKLGHAYIRTDDTIFYPASIVEYDLPSNEELQRLRYCKELVAIDIGHSKATDCEWVKYLPNLKYLVLADTKITDISPLAHAKELIYVELFDLELNDYSPLLGCTKLQDLNIGSTCADPEPLSQMTWLHNLCWYGILENPEFREDALKLPEQLPDTNVVLETWRNIGDIWRFIPNYYVFRELLDATFFNQEIVTFYWDNDEAKRVLACDHGNPVFAGDVLAEIVRDHIDNQLPIIGVKNVGSEKAEILYQTLCQVSEDYRK